MSPDSRHTWTFFRTGGLDQVSLSTAADLLALEELDQKLWVALSCPVKGLELDEKTLALIDSDGDGRIRVPELIAAVKWAAARLKDPAALLAGADSLPLSSIAGGTAEGAVLAASALHILASIGKKGATAITVAEAASTGALDASMVDASGYSAWLERGAAKDIAILGDKTADAWAALQAVSAKVEDFFGRVRLATFDPRSQPALNHSESEFAAIGAGILKLNADAASGFPIARVEPGRQVPLLEGVNPAWAAALAAVHSRAVTPLLGAGKLSLSEAEWTALNARFAPHAEWAAARPKSQAATDVERLVRYHRDLRTLLHNFVNFADFYSRDRWAAFQAGTLYLDSRATELCVRVDAANPLAAMSKVYIAYCACTRAGCPPMNIAACFTQGDSDYLFIGRHGVFYDRAGHDWDAVITGIVDNPISIRQAFWAPYKKFIRMVEEHVAKRAAAAEAASHGKLASAAEAAANADKPPTAPKKIDVGTVAALGVAVGAIGGALGAVATGLAKLAIWQIPLVLVGVILVISLPSMAIAWLKLRQRTVGPLLEGNGWAVNGRVKINIPFGTALTEVAALPPGANRSLEDPYEDKEAKRHRQRLVFYVILAAVIVLALWIRWDANSHGAQYFWQRW